MTEDAKHSFSLIDHGSVGPVLSSLCSERRKGLEATTETLLSPKGRTENLIQNISTCKDKVNYYHQILTFFTSLVKYHHWDSTYSLRANFTEHLAKYFTILLYKKKKR